MAQKHTIDTLTDDLNGFKRYVTKEFKLLKPQVQEMHEFIIDQKGFERGRANRNSDGSINISKDVWGLLVKLVLFAMAVAGITKLQ